ncbi:MAG: hypothetical protein ABI672_10120 [Vicinamibacteria bacterium]
MIQSFARSAFVLMSSVALATGATQTTPENPRPLVQKMVDAMGGADRLVSIRAIQSKGISYNHHLEQSERPEGPWIVTYAQATETRDLDHSRVRHEESSRSFFFQKSDWTPPSTWIFDDGVVATVGPNQKLVPRDAFTAQQAEEAIALGPERVGLTALSASDLHLEKDVAYRGHTHAVVAFTWNTIPVRILISRESGLPSAVESTRPHPESFFWGPWGDVTLRKSYALWTLEKNGVRLPRTVFTEWDGFAVSSQTVEEVVINPAINDADFTLPADVKQAFAARKRSVEDLPLGRPGTTPQEIAPGITQIRGSWDITIIKQSDGLVILEGPVSSGYSAKTIAEAEKTYPGLKVKAVVTTSDSWPHIGGMREFAARGVPIYALDHNQAILERLMKSTRKSIPDALAKAPKPARYTFVSKRTTVGTGANRFELIPLRTVTGERQMALWFPELKLLYCSDLFQRDQKGNFFLPQTVSETVSVVEREHLDPKSAFAMHLAVTPWTEIQDALKAYVSEGAK